MTIIDAETVEVRPAIEGPPVDPDDIPITWYDLTRRDDPRRAILPAWMHNPQQRRQVLRGVAELAAYSAAFHTSRSPKYAAKVTLYAPVGVLRSTAGVFWWAVGGRENWHLRQNAANKNDAHEWMSLNRTRAKESHARWWLVGLCAFLTVAGLLTLYIGGWVPRWGWWAALGAVTLLFARIGQPADRPIVDRVTTGPKFIKLTAEIVRDALCLIGVPGIKEPAQLSFPPPGIHRDGPGWLARVNLPAGVEAVEVLERRGKLSSALRLPIDQVWPSTGPDHPGQIDLWVGRQPASKMGQPRWSLAANTARTSVFDPVEFGTDQRQRPVVTPLFARNFLIGGVPGSGKSYAARTIAIAAALDPLCELKIAEFKGTADFGDLAHLCSTYACGVGDADLAVGMDILAWGLAEAERRGERIRKAREKGLAPEGKVTPELAARSGSGLHPVLIVIDEAHELFGDTTVGKDAAVAAERLIKRGRALGIMVVLATQIPDRSSLPPNITRCVNMRWCLAVQDQVANDMILGTGAYKRGMSATVYRPGLDAGWGILTGLAEPTSVRSHYPDPKVTAAIVARATALRGGVVGDQGDEAERVDLLGDVLHVFSTTGRQSLHWEQLAALLAEQRPELYADATAGSVSAAVRAFDVPSESIKVNGKVARGCKKDAIVAAFAAREITSG